VALLLALAASLAPEQAAAEEPAAAPEPAASAQAGPLYVLNFSNTGELLSPAELELAVRELSENTRIRNLVVIAYGWSNDGEASRTAYLDMVGGLTRAVGRTRVRPETAVIAVGWDSSQTGFRKLFNSILPLPGISNLLAWPLDKVLFPISFWSKAAQADRIGFGGLRAAMNLISGAFEGREHPTMVLIGHSFGTRIVSGLMLERLGIVPVRSDPFVGAEHVRLALLLQPAAVPANLHRDAHYPVVATMSRHDRANGFLFPIANIPLNAFGFSAFEALLRFGLARPLQTTVDTVGGVVTAPLPGVSMPTTGGRRAYPWWRTLAEIGAIPASLAFTLVALPVNYAYVQGRGLLTRPGGHLMDTLAQLPLIEIPVELLGDTLEHEVPWGQHSRGLLTLGVLQDPVGRMLLPPPFGRRTHTPFSPEQVRAAADSSECGLPVCEGLLVVDASRYVRRGMFGENLDNSAIDFTIGWLDPIGAHADYKNPELGQLLADVIETARQQQRPPPPEGE
jgi:hypothetical protein